MPDFQCEKCSQSFSVKDEVLERYPGWTPKVCMKCKKDGAGAGKAGASKAGAATKKPAARGGARSGGRSATAELDITCAEVLERFHDGPKTGVFTDGAASPNPGRGGWGACYVRDDQLVGENWGHEPHTTNNRMELVALLAGVRLVPEGEAAELYTDSELCVNTMTKWAKGWEARGWKRKDGEIKNLELVKELYYLLKSRPELTLRWIAAHSGNRWNEYADALATTYRRAER